MCTPTVADDKSQTTAFFPGSVVLQIAAGTRNKVNAKRFRPISRTQHDSVIRIREKRI